MNLILRQVRPFGGALTDMAIRDGLIVAQADGRGFVEYDGDGATLLPGLHDHHLHIAALGARRASLDLAPCIDGEEVVKAVAAFAAQHPLGSWLRAVGYDERAAGLPDASDLDRWCPDHAMRLQDRTGALWVLNRRALAVLGDAPRPPGCERDGEGRPTGRFWREDAWLGAHVPRQAIDFAALGRDLAALGVTGLTDAGATNGPAMAHTLGEAHLAGALPQHLVLMGSERLGEGAGYRRGPLKLLIDERAPPGVDALAGRIVAARAAGRSVAAHCVTLIELLLYLAALDTAGGARCGDRIEHGGVIPAALIDRIAAMGLIVATNPVFIADRGDRYRAEIPAAEWPDLYRAASLIDAGVALVAGSDAPYGQVDPWAGMRAATSRRAASGASLSPQERVSADRALALYWGHGEAPDRQRRLAVGEPADLILLRGGYRDVLADLSADRVMATIIGGKPVHIAH
ncbi:amidohydrolase [Sphingopyxis lindanitolerans]|uniref:Amidohydrolase n=1 Tax=Sphingopyxis lindanitolerans TaxID=2054227 RepID=A0A2S8B657_9SPHN|nr:amidohydrolase family protein [Sphingopyxis lindanitolerans]PQM27739.1 amidohydrolase [Sphingopyxis lindanitolerans]